jgi:hypothetical protein
MTVAAMANFSDKEKDEAGLSDGFRQDSLDAFILRFAGIEGVFVFHPRSRSRSRLPGDFRGRERGRERGRFIPRWSLNRKPGPWIIRGTKLKDQPMKKVRFVSLALAGLSVLSAARAATIAENFSANPLSNGWLIFGDTNLFQWDSTNQNLAVTWDSSRTNSYFYHPLGTILTRQDDFSVAFDLQLNDVTVSSYGMEISAGFLNFSNATNTNFDRANGVNPNLAEFDFFPTPDYEAISPALVSSNGQFAAAFDLPVPLAVSNSYHIVMTYTAANQTLSTFITNNHDGRPVGPIDDVNLNDYGTSFSDFRLDSVAISSYSAANDIYGDSTLAHGIVDNLVVTVPPPPIQNLTGSFTNCLWQAQFTSRSNWLYTLQRTTNLVSWNDIPISITGNGTNLFLSDTNPPADKAFYRIRAERP